MTSFSSVLTRAPMTPREVSRRYSKLLLALKMLITSDEVFNPCGESDQLVVHFNFPKNV